MRKLESLVRQHRNEASATTRRPPAELRDGAPKHIAYSQAAADQVEVVVDQMAGDLRFEHLAQPKQTVWDFAAYCFLRRQDSHVKAFMRQYTQPPVERTCYLSLEYLRVEQPIALHEIQLLLLLTDPAVPHVAALQRAVDRADSVAAVPVTGTHLGKMADRARARVAHELRLLQVGLRTATRAANSQLRFRVGTAYTFADGGPGWTRAAGAAEELTLSQRLVDVAAGYPAWGLTSHRRQRPGAPSAGRPWLVRPGSLRG